MSAYSLKIEFAHLSVSVPVRGLKISCMVDLEANNSPTLVFSSSS